MVILYLVLATQGTGFLELNDKKVFYHFRHALATHLLSTDRFAVPELIESLFLVNPAGMLQDGEAFR